MTNGGENLLFAWSGCCLNGLLRLFVKGEQFSNAQKIEVGFVVDDRNGGFVYIGDEDLESSGACRDTKLEYKLVIFLLCL